eukprot:TRINITY_DN64660_c0_g1_i1.p1 TRINITY_DN64660_c0_g1~~TRINITY_DN64660_c0_g1_i1.p1  ORF type:complete len:200 (-),score=37.28 TRINITY_DN64660_c0_g1_i1:3-569(-)
MSDVWVEVRTGDKKYYWNAADESVVWDPPPGVRVVWATEKHAGTGKTYYWNKETNESCWNLPALEQKQGASVTATMTAREERPSWADVKDDPIVTGQVTVESSPRVDGASEAIWSAINGKGAGDGSGHQNSQGQHNDYDDAGGHSQVHDQGWWPLGGSEEREWRADCHSRFMQKALSIRGVREGGMRT